MFEYEAVGAGNFQHIRYLTVSAYKNDIQQARSYFNRIGSELSAYLARLGSRCEEMDATEKLELIHNFFRPEEEAYFHFNAEDMARKGHDFKDYICPDCFELGRDFFRMGDRYGRVIFLRDYANFIKDDIITELTDIGASMMLSIERNKIEVLSIYEGNLTADICNGLSLCEKLARKSKDVLSR